MKKKFIIGTRSSRAWIAAILLMAGIAFSASAQAQMITEEPPETGLPPKSPPPPPPPPPPPL